MDVKRYQNEPEYVNAYSQLIREIYAEYPLFIEAKLKETKRSLDQNNPFLDHGSYSNYLLLDKDKPVANISAIMDSRLPAHIGLVGCFESLNNKEFANHIFDEARKYLMSHGKKHICGPINFTTWQHFRVSYPESHPPFFIEPFSRGYYRDLFRGYGFSVAHQNVSTIEEVERTTFTSFADEMRRLEREHMIFESMNPQRVQCMIQDIYALTKEIFRDTWAFVPIGFEEFEFNIRDSVSLLDGDFVYLVRSREKLPVAFCFCVPDLYSQDKKRVIVKTMGVLPGYQDMGIGKALFYLLYRTAVEKEVSELIFSTMRSDNVRIRNLTGSRTIYREYEAYELRL